MLLRFATILIGAAVCASAAPRGDDAATALDALKRLPKAQLKNVARIEAREGTPAPERWHVLVHEPGAENGLREYVIAGGEIVASRNLSQFAETLTAGDVIGADAVKFDSDRAGKLLQQFAVANDAVVASIDYELRKEGPDAAPLWKVTGVDEGGKAVGSIYISAGKGAVIAHEDFPLEPRSTPKREKSRPESRPQVAQSESPRPSEEPFEPPPVRSSRPEQDEPRSGFLRRTGGRLQRFFTGRDTISR